MNTLTRCKPLLGTYVDISLTGEATDDQLIEVSNTAFAEIERIHNLMSFHRADSELTKINKQAFLGPVPITPDMEAVLSHALLLSALTSGIYDITVANELMHHGGLPNCFEDAESGTWNNVHLLDGKISFNKNIKLDLGGIAKGYAVDKAIDVIAAQPIELTQVCVNAGGDLRFQDWCNEKVNIRHPSPKRRDQFIAIDMQAPALATSAPEYTNKNSLIVEPETGSLISTDDSISVFAPSCMIADALTKVLFLKPDSIDILEQFKASALRIERKGTTVPFLSENRAG
ncbi:MAG: FAD:protein FMN transferase [Kordiimonas sp.]